MLPPSIPMHPTICGAVLRLGLELPAAGPSATRGGGAPRGRRTNSPIGPRGLALVPPADAAASDELPPWGSASPDDVGGRLAGQRRVRRDRP